MKKIFKISFFCLAPLFIFSLYVFSAVDARLLAVKPAVRKDAVKTIEKPQTSSVPALRVVENGGTLSGPAVPEIKALAGKADAKDYTEFDDFNNVSDPLYREGSKVLLKQAVDEDLAPAAVVKKTSLKKPELMRDAPADIPATAIRPVPVKAGNENNSPILPVKHDRLMKLVPADPVKTKPTL